MATEVYVQRDGIVNHRHRGRTDWHDPAAQHRDATLHSRERADAPENLSTLTSVQRVQYEQSLAGNSLYPRYFEALAARRKAAGSSWPYAKKR
jgi:hypothetical protein